MDTRYKNMETNIKNRILGESVKNVVFCAFGVVTSLK